MHQRILEGPEGRTALLAGINKANNVIKVTLGPKGRNVVVKPLHAPTYSTKDGIKALGEITLPDPFENMGVEMSREGSKKTADSAGDATTTTHIIATAMMNLANGLIIGGMNPVAVKKIITEKAAEASAWVTKNAIKIDGKNYIEKLRHIATISANNNEEIGTMFAEAYTKTGLDGKISLEVGDSDHTELEVIPGYYFNQGMLHPYFITNPKKAECELELPLVLLYDRNISEVTDILAPLEFAKENKRALLIICGGIQGEALGTVVVNKRDYGLKVCVVQCPLQGAARLALLEDMAIYTKAEVISEELGKSMTKDYFEPAWLGTAGKAIIGKDRTIIIDGQGNPKLITARQEEIKSQIKEAKSDHLKEDLKDRIANMDKGVSILYIGGKTPMEIKDKLDLAEDAILAVRSGIEEGYLPGGGISYLKCAQAISEGGNNNNLVAEALTAPFFQILANAGADFKGTIGEVALKKGNYGYNAKTDEWGDLVAAGVIDAAKVIRNAIENAAAVASMFVYTESLMAEFKD